MNSLMPLAAAVAESLRRRKETIAVAESSAGGLISAALLSVPGASAYFLGGAVIYTLAARKGLLGIENATMKELGLRPSTEPYAVLLARTVAERHGATWGLGESGATGPTGNRYGDAAGHAAIAVSGPVSRTLTLETGSADREANMRCFGEAALKSLIGALESAA